MFSENLNYFHKTSKQFFNKFTKNFNSHMQKEQFNKFRLYFLNLAENVKYLK